MTDADLDELGRLAKAATSGRWAIDPASDETFAVHAPKGGSGSPATTWSWCRWVP